MSVMQFEDAEHISIVATIGGVRWTGILYDAVLARDGEIASAVADRIDAGEVVEPYAAPLPTEGEYASAIQSLVDETAKARGYANGVALSGYVASSVDAWASEAATFIAWRDAVWLYAYAELAKVQSGQRQQPTIQELMAELIPINWTA